VPASDAYALVVDHLTARYGSRTVLDGLSLRAERALLTAVLGPNGAGKTTLVRCCTGLLKPAAGTVSVLGESPGSKHLASRVGLMPQSTGAWSGVRARELLRYLAGLYAHPIDVDALISRFGIAAYAKTAYRRLSGGQQQAVNLAAALVGRPELVFLDEPTAGLDPRARRSTWDLLRELRTAGVSVVLTTHAMDEAAELADQVYIVDRGVVTAAGTVPELTSDGRDLESVYLANTYPPGGRGGSSPPGASTAPGGRGGVVPPGASTASAGP
jgi:ABC-2 type transport system ATP-binding protein